MVVSGQGVTSMYHVEVNRGGQWVLDCRFCTWRGAVLRAAELRKSGQETRVVC
jgi:hypothetical protein